MEWRLYVCLVVNHVKMNEPIGVLLRDGQYIRIKHKRVLNPFQGGVLYSDNKSDSLL